MLDYKNIIIKRYTLNLSFKELAEEFGASKSGVNDFIRAFEKCDKLSYPLPEGITNYAISELVYGHVPGSNNRSSEYEQPDFEWVFRQMNERKNMTLTYPGTAIRKTAGQKKQSHTSTDSSANSTTSGVKRTMKPFTSQLLSVRRWKSISQVRPLN